MSGSRARRTERRSRSVRKSTAMSAEQLNDPIHQQSLLPAYSPRSPYFNFCPLPFDLISHIHPILPLFNRERFDSPCGVIRILAGAGIEFPAVQGKGGRGRFRYLLFRAAHRQARRSRCPFSRWLSVFQGLTLKMIVIIHSLPLVHAPLYTDPSTTSLSL